MEGRNFALPSGVTRLLGGFCACGFYRVPGNRAQRAAIPVQFDRIEHGLLLAREIAYDPSNYQEHETDDCVRDESIFVANKPWWGLFPGLGDYYCASRCPVPPKAATCYSKMMNIISSPAEEPAARETALRSHGLSPATASSATEPEIPTIASRKSPKARMRDTKNRLRLDMIFSTSVAMPKAARFGSCRVNSARLPESSSETTSPCVLIPKDDTPDCSKPRTSFDHINDTVAIHANLAGRRNLVH